MYRNNCSAWYTLLPTVGNIKRYTKSSLKGDICQLSGKFKDKVHLNILWRESALNRRTVRGK
jgi:hypothetical protein